MNLYEKYRAKTFAEIVGQEKALRVLLALKNQSWVGQAILFVGPSGTGKTSMARLVAASAADSYATLEIDAQDLSMDTLREYERLSRFRPLGKGCHCFIVNECHGMSSKVVSRMQTVLEAPETQRTTLWMFTTTNKGQQSLFDTRFDALPFLSRCATVETFKDQACKIAFAQRAMEIAQAENLDGQPISAYLKLAVECDCNLRQMIQRIAGGEMLR
jgi:replication-associated recombination protein RarA